MRQINIEYIKKWVDISEEELMFRLVKDALGLMQDAEKNEKAFEKEKRLSDPEYRRILLKFWKDVPYLRQYFSDDEIVTAAAGHMSYHDIVTEHYVRGYRESGGLNNWEFLRHERRHAFEECKGGWTRTILDEASVFRIPANYQSVQGSKAVKELVLNWFEYLKDYKVTLYDVSNANDWIFVTIEDHSLYTPLSALFEKNKDKIVNTHLKYWHNYAEKYDEREQAFVESEAVQEFLSKIVQ